MDYDEAVAFVDHLSLGLENFFMFDGVPHLVQGVCENGYRKIYIFPLVNEDVGITWEARTTAPDYDMDAFLGAPIFNGKTFWEVYKEIEWTD